MREFVSDFVLPFGSLVAVLLAAVAFGSGLADALTPDPECGTHWIVRAGDTLWHVARTCYPHVDRRMAVDAIQAANPGTEAGALQAGDRLVLPGAQVAGGGR